MKQSITPGMFNDAFHNMGRLDQFSYTGLRALYDYLEDIDPDYDLDVIAICCEYSEMSLDEARKAYDIPEEDSVADYINERSSVVYSDDKNIMFSSF